MAFGRMGQAPRFGHMGAGGVKQWLLGASLGIPATIDMYFQQGKYFGRDPTGLTVTRTTQKTNLVYTSASGYSYSTFSSGTAAITAGFGLLVEEARTNIFLNSTAPATQTITLSATGNYTLWVNGSGSAAIAAGTATITGAGTATNGTPVTINCTVTGTVTVTVSGSLNAAQLEAGAFPTSLIVTAGASATRNADMVSLTSAPAFGSAYTTFGKGTPLATNASSNNQVIIQLGDGSANNRAQSYRSTTGQFGAVVTSGGVSQYNTTASTWSQATSAKFALATTANDQQGVYNGTLMTAGTGASLPVGVNNVYIGNFNNNNSQFNGFVERIAIWPSTRVSNANLQSLTT